jgi:hypothetical protein
MSLLLFTSLLMLIYLENSTKKHEIEIKYIKTKNYHQCKNKKVFESVLFS